MSDIEKIFMPSFTDDAGEAHGVFSPFNPSVRVFKAGYRIGPSYRPLPVDIVFEKDIPVILRDGVTIYTDVFRPAGVEKMPVIVAWSPYGKSQGTAPRINLLYDMLGLAPDIVSGLAKWEGPDPAYWCAHGYAVCNSDARGIADSGGDSVMFGRQEGQDCHDLIEWAATQDWCTGKVAMSGTSYLSILQWFAAAEQPPHLTAINPWEGFSDVYRDLVMRGGIPDFGFADLLKHNYAGKTRREDIVAEAERYPLMNSLWEDKIARFDKITIPAYVVASYSNTLHTAGTFRAWRRIASEKKWLRIHNTLEWPDYYAHVEDQRRFFDHYLKGLDNGWEQTPRVRYSLLDMEGGDRLEQAASTFPPEKVIYRKYYLDGDKRTLELQAPKQETTAVYDTASDPGLVSFVIKFDEETVLVGYPKARLWVEAQGADDLELFLLIQKLNGSGSPLQQFTAPNQGARMQDLTEGGMSILRYKGADGRLRVSARRLDPSASTDAVPAHAFDRVEKLAPGEVVEVEIELLPIGLVFHPGEQLRFVIASHSLLGPMMVKVAPYIAQNSGQHVIHVGGDKASYLQLPVKAA